MSADIRNLYTPVQPTVKQTADHVTYSEFLPHKDLLKFIYCYWQLKTARPLSHPFVYRVVADGCIDIFFDLSTPRDNFVMGFCRKFTEFPLEKSFHYVGVRFLPTMFPQLFRIDASVISNRFVELHTIAPAAAGFIAGNFQSDQTMADITKVFDAYFLDLMSNTPFDNDRRLYGAIEIILKQSGVVDIEQGLDTGLSPRQLRRLFNYYVGDTAKTFAKVVRFQNILRAKPSSQSLRQNRLFSDVSYYDQSHFIKEFKTFYGVTPGKVFQR